MERHPVTPHVTVLVGERGGRYPSGSSLLVEGSQESLLLDPSLAVAALPAAELPRIDRVVNSHCHEDHIAGNHRFPAVPWHLPALDLAGIRSIDAMMAIYGFEPVVDAVFRRIVLEQFHFTPRPDALGYSDGAVFDLGGVCVRMVHAPGHTRGHSLAHVEPDDVLYLGDIDLSSFGPYYGDAWSSLEDFERTLVAVRAMEARWYATFHHVGILDGRTAFLERLDRFAAVIAARQERLLAFLAAPHTLDEIAAHRFVYRPGDSLPYAEVVERRSMSQHLERLGGTGRVREVEPGRFVAVAG